MEGRSACFFFLLALLNCPGPRQPLHAQGEDLRVLADTSYFREGEDDWNLVESVIRGAHANVLFLLERGADPDARAEGGMPALTYAAEQGDTLMVRLLVLNGADPDLSFGQQTTPLIVAVLNQQFEVAQILLRKGADPDHKDELGGSPLLYAAALNDYAMADLLLYYGASDSIRDDRGNDPLMTAVYFGHTETADVLLQNGLSPDPRDRKANTPLMVAAQNGTLDLIALLLEYDAALEATNQRNYTPLAHAIAFEQVPAAELLIDSGAHIHHHITPGLNLHDLAMIRRNEALQHLLREKGASRSPRPSFTQVAPGWGHSFRPGEYLMQTRVALLDRKFGFFLETGFDFRPFPVTTQVRQSGNLILQHRETRYAWSHGIGKYFRLRRDQFGMEYGMVATIHGMWSFPRYRGTDRHPPADYSLVPGAGVYIMGKNAGFKWGAERYRFNTLGEGTWKMNVTVLVRFSMKTTGHAPKEIYY